MPSTGFTDYIVEVGGASWQDEISWSIDDDKGVEWHAGGSPYFFSTCPTPSPTVCSGYPFIVDLSDTYGDGWQGNEMSFLDCAGNVMKNGISLIDGAFERRYVCLDSPKFEISVGGGTWGAECAWNVTDAAGHVLFSGASPFDDDNCDAVHDDKTDDAPISPCSSETELWTVHMSDSYGDGWNGNYLKVLNCDGSLVDEDHEPLTIEGDKFSEEAYICVPVGLEQYTIEAGGALWQEEVSWSIDDAAGVEIHAAGSPYVWSTCPTPSPTVCSGYSFVVELSDSFGDGWQGNTISFLDCKGNVQKDGITMVDGAYEERYVCLDAPTFQVKVGGGTWGDEVRWFVTSSTGVVLFSGSSPFDDNNCPDDDNGGGGGGGGGGDDDAGGGDDGGGRHGDDGRDDQQSTAGSVVGDIFGTLGALALVGAGIYHYAKAKGYASVGEFIDSFSGESYSPMGGAAARAGGSASTFNQLHAEVSGSGGQGGSDGVESPKYGFTQKGGGGVGGYQPPAVHAVPVDEENDDEEEVSMPDGKFSASV